MHIINDQALATGFRRGTVTTAESKKYIAGMIVLFCVMEVGGRIPGLLAVLSGEQEIDLLYWIRLATVVVWWSMMFGISYVANISGDGRDYLRRTVCLMFPVYLRSFALFLAFNLLLAIGVFVFGAGIILVSDNSVYHTIVDWMGFGLFLIYAICRQHTSMSIASGSPGRLSHRGPFSNT